MNPGMPNPNALRAQKGEIQQALSGLEEAIPQLEGAISQLRAEVGQLEAVVNNPQLPPEQRAQYLQALEARRNQIVELESRLEEYKRARSVYKAQLMKITGYLAAMSRAQSQQQQQAVHAEGSSNRG